MTSEECYNTEGSFECVCKQGYFKNGQDKCIGIIYINTCIVGRTYFVERSIHLIEENWLLIITEVQASGLIIDRLLRQCWKKKQTKKRSMITPEAETLVIINRYIFNNYSLKSRWIVAIYLPSRENCEVNIPKTTIHRDWKE